MSGKREVRDGDAPAGALSGASGAATGGVTTSGGGAWTTGGRGAWTTGGGGATFCAACEACSAARKPLVGREWGGVARAPAVIRREIARTVVGHGGVTGRAGRVCDFAEQRRGCPWKWRQLGTEWWCAWRW
ncbi:hypothetical protein K438DRAFT_1770815 [Mycena galopus ATCC 62051]|nr:hypothetical protein K438DRAFT_1770815 [Mycena galopus ATCC 62051]